MYYVAATRARDLLALPVPLTKGRMEYANAALVTGLSDELIQRFETFRVDTPPAWVQAAGSPRAPVLTADETMQAHLDAVRSTFAEAVERATQPLALPAAVTLEAQSSPEDASSLYAERARKAESNRFGKDFGSTVHRALELAVSGAIHSVAGAVALAAQETGLTDHLADAEADVQRALATLHELQIHNHPAMHVCTEYPLAMRWRDGKLLNGVIDLLAVSADVAFVIDFKTDMPLSGTLVAAYPRYAAQLQLYGEMLRAAGVTGARRLRLGLLLTASGEFREL